MFAYLFCVLIHIGSCTKCYMGLGPSLILSLTSLQARSKCHPGPRVPAGEARIAVEQSGRFEGTRLGVFFALDSLAVRASVTCLAVHLEACGNTKDHAPFESRLVLFLTATLSLYYSGSKSFLSN